jgi:uncharacterized membrane protein
MFQTHAYDAWIAEPYRQGYLWWLARQFLGGYPARMFLLLAGVSLMLRYAGDDRRGRSEAEARRGAVSRGFEVFLLGYAFRLAEWIVGGARPAAMWALLKFDVLQCIGVTLMVAALLASPRDVRPGRLPLRPIVAALVAAFLTPHLQALGRPRILPAWLSVLLWGDHDLVPFPLFPWVAYTLTGCFLGVYFVRAAAAGRLGRTILITAGLGVLAAALGQLLHRLDVPSYRATALVPVPASPASYLFRTGTCMVGLAAAYALERWRSQRPSPTTQLAVRWQRFSPLLWLGQASMTVYMVHLDLVYNIWSYPIKHRLGPYTASAVLVALTGAMVWLAHYRLAGATVARHPPLTMPQAVASRAASGKELAV